ncbi:AraC family transcriptional regulator [Fulvimarina sp. 2208YS6-2-32]|uniref:AraC family transcriptional regulator n=1 Tax=Fulvimarina uroteuthidis TaxID=3098149 RepID=A0ABU5I3Q6_9HYPH|nr:AraC family transcriptional regulator [Fulvimarina sp. 2208YS6-2-32]MDY8109403.1 AraC family transcriptional regulator [Fulvimarina sp. 2208YS6-2-32]
MTEASANRLHRLSWLNDVEVYDASFDTHVFGRHAHTTFAIGAILEGVGGYHCRGSSHVLPAGTLSCMNPEEAHTGRAVSGRLRYTMVYVGEAGIAEMLGIERIRGFRDVSPSDRSQIVMRVMSALAIAIRRPEREPGWRLQVEHLVHRLITSAFVGFAGAKAMRPGKEPLAVRHLSDRISAQIISTDNTSFSVAEAAKELGLHPNYLIQSFSRAKGISPYAYFLSRKIEAAKNLLSLGHPPLQVGLMLGFYDQPHFNRSFKKLMGFTPGDYIVH